MQLTTALFFVAGLASSVLAEPAATTTAKTAASTAINFHWTVPASGAIWTSPQGQSISWTGTSPPTFDLVLINQNATLQPYQQMIIATNIPTAWKNVTLTPAFGPATNFALLAVNSSNHAQTYAQSGWFTVTGGNGHFAGFQNPPASTTAPAAAATTTTPAAAGPSPAAAGTTTPAVPAPGTSTTFVPSTGIVAAAAAPTSGASHLVGGSFLMSSALLAWLLM